MVAQLNRVRARAAILAVAAAALVLVGCGKSDAPAYTEMESTGGAKGATVGDWAKQYEADKAAGRIDK